SVNTSTKFNYSYARSIVGYLAYFVFARTTKLAMGHFSELDLTTKEGLVLEFVSKNPDASQKDIAQAAGMKPSFLVKILDNLTARELLLRKPDRNDRRRQNLALTPAGEELLGQIHACHMAGNDEIFAEAGLTDDEIDTLFHLLKKLTAHLQK
ncbi:MAG: MarR family transcriptional regulator, partial [Chloroflexota bacterium]